jgi:hypothetical protein
VKSFLCELSVQILQNLTSDVRLYVKDVADNFGVENDTGDANKNRAFLHLQHQKLRFAQ